MKVRLIAVGTKMPAWVVTAFNEYQKRMPPLCKLELQEVNAQKRGKNVDISRVLATEARDIRQQIPADYQTICLERRGKVISTDDLAREQQRWIDDNQNIALVIGGPEGIDKSLLDESIQIWSLSAMTFAHPLVRVMVAEQLYRAWSINANLPYHRGD
ncbi:MAG: 23S rRNA (pseudouridine(1915)-N(3))-methyltransferase RlmH [Pseudomonadota bacterium]